MKAGRKLDALITEKVMGEPLVWAFVEPMRHPHDGHIYDHQYVACGKHTSKAHRVYPTQIGKCFASYDEYTGVPEYSTDIAAAWQVVEKLKEKGWTCFLDNADDTHDCEFARMEDEKFTNVEERGDTAPLAICLAALKAVGVDTK